MFCLSVGTAEGVDTDKFETACFSFLFKHLNLLRLLIRLVETVLNITHNFWRFFGKRLKNKDLNCKVTSLRKMN